MKSALEIAASVKAGETSAREVTEEYLSNIAEKDSEIGAFLYVAKESALNAAENIDKLVAEGKDPGPLAGVPVALKDNLCVRGVPTTCASKILEGWKPPYTATAVQRLTDAGAIPIGKANLDEFAMGSSTENSAFQKTLNPINTAYVPGGSSGGSAAAVAGGFAPIAIGSDTGGSIRQPAALCGTVGIKPTYGKVSRYGLIAFASSLDQIGPIANNVLDSALTLQVLSGHDPLDSTSIPEEASDYVAVLKNSEPSDVSDLKVGVAKEFMGDGVSPQVLGAVNKAADILAGAGAKVSEASIPAAIYGLPAYYVIAPAEASSNLARYDGVRYGMRLPAKNTEEMNIATRTQGFGDEVKRRIMLGTFALSAGYYDAYYVKAQRVRTLIARDFAKAYEEFDVLLTPTSPFTAFKFGEKTSDPLAMYSCDVCTIPSSLSGDPAISIPFGKGEDDMPVGVQVLAPALGELNMLRTAYAIEQLGK